MLRDARRAAAAVAWSTCSSSCSRGPGRLQPYALICRGLAKKSGKGKVRGFKPHEEEAADDASFKLVVQVEPKYMRTVPIKHDYADRFHEKIPEDHEADEWFNARVARYEENLPMLIALGGPRGPKRPT